MLTPTTRRTLLLLIAFFFTLSTFANDSDIVNCNRAWKIAVLGSSTSFGTGASTYDSSWAGKFTSYVKRKNSQSEIYNFGIPGYTTYQNLCPTGFIPPANRPLPNSSFNITAALDIHPDALIINMPSNDVANGYSVEEQQANFERAVRLADSANVPVWITTTQPRNGITSAQISNLTIMRDWIHSRFGDKAVDFWTGIANGDGTIVNNYLYDYVHVNNAGHDIFYKRIVAETILDSLCIRVTQTLVARAGNDISVTLPASGAVLNGSGSISSNGGIITGYQWTKISGPANGQVVSPNSAITNISNLTEGRYSFSLTVTDNALNVKSDTVNVLVSSRILIDFGPETTISPDANGNFWNTISDAQPGIKLQNSVTTGNASTTIGLEVINRIDGTFNVAGPGTSTGNTLGAINEYPASATTDFAFAETSATNGLWKISGLEASKQYSIKFWGTRSVSDDRVIQIKRADQSVWQEYNAANNINFNTSAIFSFSGKTQMSFDIRVKSGSAFGHICLIDILRTTPAVAINIPPVAKANDVTVSLPASSGILDGSASIDEDGSITGYQWRQISGPSVATLASPTNAITTVSNLVQGIYSFRLTVTDDSSAVSFAVATLTVSSRILFDFGPESTTGPDAGGKYWNNIADGRPGIKVVNAVTTGNTATILSLEIINRIDGSFNTGGPGTNTGNTAGIINDYPASATTDFAFAHSSATDGNWKIDGLDSLKQYSIKFWGTRDAGDERVIQIKVAGDTIWQEYEARNNRDYNNAAVFTFYGKTAVNFDIRVKDNSTFGHISLIDINITNPPVNCTPAVTITSDNLDATCAGTAITFTAVATNGGTAPVYQWRKNGININGAGASTYSSSSLSGGDVISCILTSNASCASGTAATSNEITIAILAPVKLGNVSGPSDPCPFINTANNAVYTVSPFANVSLYTWTVPAGATIVSGQGTTSITVSFSSSFGSTGVITVYGGTCSNGSPGRLNLIKNVPAVPAAITGPVNACPYPGTGTQATYAISAVPYATSYIWTLPANVTLVSGQGTASINVLFAAAFTTSPINVKAVSNCETSADRSLTITATSTPLPGEISGPAEVCAYIGSANQATYSIRKLTGVSSYIWTVPAGASIASHPASTGINDTIIKVSFNSTFVSGTSISVQSVGCITSALRSLTILKLAPPAPGAITGPSEACAYMSSSSQATYTIRKVTGVSAYIWTAPAGATIASHPGGIGANDTIIKVYYSSSLVSGSAIGVQSAGCIPSAKSSIVINKPVPPTPGVITIVADPCKYQNYAPVGGFTIRKVNGATSYTWIVPAGSTVYHSSGTGVNDTSLAVMFPMGFTTGTVSVIASNGCGSNNIASTVSVKSVTPATISLNLSGPTDPCPYINTANGAIYKVNKIHGVTSYTWTVPSNGTSVTHPNGSGVNDTVIVVKFTGSFTSGNITVQANTVCGSSPVKSLSLVKQIPSIPGTITTTLLSSCPNRRYKYSIASLPANATSVTWTIPSAATIVSGQGTTSITVSYPTRSVASSIKAYGTNGCGNSADSRTLNISLPACAGGRGINNEAAENELTGELISEEMEITVMPNPSYSDFKLIIKSGDKLTPVSLRISNVSGRIIEDKQHVLPGQMISLGAGYEKGIYIGEVVQGSKRTVIKLIKL